MRTALVALLLCAASCLTDFDDFTFVPPPGAVASSAATTSGSGGSVAAIEVACGDVTCDVAAGETCCLTKPDGEGRCVAQGDDCLGNETSVWCDGPEDCDGGEVCCGDTSVGFDELQCRQSCDGAGQIVICDADEPDPCPGNDDCVPSMTLPNGYEVCN